MIVINERELIVEPNIIGKGNFSEVRKVIFDNKEYCFKYFTRGYSKDIINNICSLTDIKFKKQYLVPLYMVETSSGDIIGYLTNYNNKLENIKNVTSRNERILLLKNTKKIIEELHSQYKIIHGDIVKENLLFDIEKKKSFLLDFDSSLKIGTEPQSTDSFRIFVKDYIKYYSHNIGLDIYTFNVTTLMILSNMYQSVDVLFDDIKYGDYHMQEENKEIKKLTKELLLRNTRKEYSGEYIIDYL